MSGPGERRTSSTGPEAGSRQATVGLNRSSKATVEFGRVATPMSISENLKAWAKRIKRDGVTLWFACKNPRTPWYAKALGVFVVAYALSPIDLIPDFIPVLGQLDEVVIIPLLLYCALKCTPQHVIDNCRNQIDTL